MSLLLPLAPNKRPGVYVQQPWLKLVGRPKWDRSLCRQRSFVATDLKWFLVDFWIRETIELYFHRMKMLFLTVCGVLLKFHV